MKKRYTKEDVIKFLTLWADGKDYRGKVVRVAKYLGIDKAVAYGWVHFYQFGPRPHRPAAAYVAEGVQAFRSGARARKFSGQGGLETTIVTDSPKPKKSAPKGIKTEEVVTLFKTGVSPKDIGKRLGINVNTVYYHLEKAGLKTRKKRRQTVAKKLEWKASEVVKAENKVEKALRGLRIAIEEELRETLRDELKADVKREVEAELKTTWRRRITRTLGL